MIVKLFVRKKTIKIKISASQGIPYIRIVWIMTTTKYMGYLNFSRAIENSTWIARRATVEQQLTRRLFRRPKPGLFSIMQGFLILSLWLNKCRFFFKLSYWFHIHCTHLFCELTNYILFINTVIIMFVEMLSIDSELFTQQKKPTFCHAFS